MLKSQPKEEVDVLFVDADLHCYEEVIRILQDLGLKVAIAGERDEAVSKLEESTPKVLVLDYFMPGSDYYIFSGGRETYEWAWNSVGGKSDRDMDQFLVDRGMYVLRRAIAMAPKMPVVVFTKAGDEKYVQAAKELGVREVVGKRFDGPSLRRSSLEKLAAAVVSAIEAQRDLPMAA
jgi:CheY-like chemotaxis protein